MKITLTNEELTSVRISKTFTLDVGGKEIRVHKFTIEDAYEAFADTEIEAGQDIIDSLDENQQEELNEFINELPMIK